MESVFRKIVTAFLIVVAVNFTALAQSYNEAEAINELLNERDIEIKKILGPKGSKHTDEQRDQLKLMINDIIDFHYMAKIALQETYYEINDEARENFVDLFASIIRDQSLAKLDIYRAEVTYENIDVTGDSAFVQTLAELENVRTPVSYTMLKRDNRWFIGDMIIDDVSTAKSYQRSFQSVIKRKGFDALLTSLKKRAARNKG